MENKKKKILLIKLSSLGDVIHNIPLANALKDSGYEVTWLVSEKGYDVVKNNPCVDKTILAPIRKWRRKGFSIENFKEYLGILKQLRSEKFNIAIDAQMMLKSLCWMIFCGAKRRIISKGARELSILGGNEWIDNILHPPDLPIVLKYLKYARYLGIKPEKIKVTLPKRDTSRIEKTDKLLSDLDSQKPTVVIAPATTWANKHWKKDHWQKVVNSIADRCNLIFSGGACDNELVEYISCGRGLNLCGKTDVLDLMELFSRADLVISPDSGSAHLAWAAQKPAVITIFTCTPKQVLAPLGSPDKYIALGADTLPCQTCFKRKCKLRKNINACTDFPDPNEVIEVINSLIF